MKSAAWSVAAAIAATPLALAAPGDSLVSIVRAATRAYQNHEDAIAAGWLPSPACVSGPQEGAMGVHYVNGDLLDGQLDAERPEALIYERRGGQMRLVGVEYIELADAWHANHAAPPVLHGQQFHYVGSPNRYGIPPFYELHVWAWRNNPHGTFADWNPHVSCDGFTGE